MTLRYRSTLRTSACLALSALLFIQCGGDQKSADSPAETMPGAEPPPPAEAAAATTRPTTPESADPATSAAADATSPPAALDPLSDEQIAGITDAANSAEIAQAKLAQTKSKDAGVKKFAAMMVTHHGEAKQKQAKLKLKPADSPALTSLQSDAASTLTTLKASTGKDFDRAYVTAQVDEHQKVLDTISGKLLPNAKNADLKAYLEEVRTRVEQHLTEAKQLQQTLDSSAVSAGSSSNGGSSSNSGSSKTPGAPTGPSAADGSMQGNGGRNGK